MLFIVRMLLAFLAISVRSRMSLQLEIIALGHQLAVYQRSIGIRPDCLDHLIVLNARHLRTMIPPRNPGPFRPLEKSGMIEGQGRVMP